MKQVEGINILCSGQEIETTSTRVDTKLTSNCFFHLQNWRWQFQNTEYAIRSTETFLKMKGEILLLSTAA